MLVALAGSLLASSLSARIYLSEQLAMKNSDNASALALSLSLREPDAVEVELAVSALFDSGHYESIRVTDPLGKIIVERKMAPGYRGAPAWFVRSLPIVPQPGQAQISSGWKQFGTVHLESHSHFAYAALWKSVWELAGALFVATLIGGYLGTLILRRLRAPLLAVIGQAKAITERRFVTIEEPRVPELKQLATAMNFTVSRLKAMFEEEAGRLDTVRREANCDSLTGLANRSHFLARLHEALEAEDSHGIGLILVRVADLMGINRRLGRDATDDLLRRFAAVMSEATKQHPDSLAARLNGADFSLLLMGQSGVREQAESLMQNLVQEASAFVVDAPAAHIGLGVFPRGIELSAALSQVDAALAAAEAEGANAIREAGQAAGEDAPRSADEWSRLIRHALDERWVKLISFPVGGFRRAPDSPRVSIASDARRSRRVAAGGPLSADRRAAQADVQARSLRRHTGTVRTGGQARPERPGGEPLGQLAAGQGLPYEIAKSASAECRARAAPRGSKWRKMAHSTISTISAICAGN